MYPGCAVHELCIDLQARLLIDPGQRILGVVDQKPASNMLVSYSIVTTAAGQNSAMINMRRPPQARRPKYPLLLMIDRVYFLETNPAAELVDLVRKLLVRSHHKLYAV